MMELGKQAMILSNNKLINSNDSSHDQIVRSSNKVGASRSSRKKIVGVTKRNGRKYGVKVYDRIRKKDLCLGTFDTAEEASTVYLSKKKELEEELQRNVIGAGKRTSKYVGVWKRDSGKFAAHIRDPIKKKKLYLGAFESEEEAAEAYLAKKAELEEEVKGKGIRWMPKRECRKSKCLEMTKNDDELGQCIEENDSNICLDNHAIDMDDSERDLIHAGTQVYEANSPSLEYNQESSKQIDNSDYSNGESALSNAVPDEKLPALEENVDCLSSENQESSNDVDNSDSSHKESASIEKNGRSAEKELILVDSRAGSLVNTGAQILLRTNSGTPLLDSNGILLGKYSWIDDLGLSISM